MAISIEAPDDVEVLICHVKAGPVSAGDKLYVLRCLPLEQLRLRIEFIREYLDLTERPFLDGRIAAQMANLKNKADALKLIHERNEFEVTLRDKAYELVYPNHRVMQPRMHIDISSYRSDQSRSTTLTKETGKPTEISYSETITPTPSPDYRPDIDLFMSFVRGKTEYGDAQLAFDHASLQHRDTTDKIALIRQKVHEYEAIYQKKKSQLQIVCPLDGAFTARIVEGGFARKGHTLGEIVP